ncbi:MAG: carboxypeptidase-like regulatory domain-containing protein [Acidobacteriota bacterium]
MILKLARRSANMPSPSVEACRALSALCSLLLMLAAFIETGQSQVLPARRKDASNQQAQKRADSISGRVTDESGQPFPNVVVYVRPVNGRSEEDLEVATDDEGGFQVNGLPAKASVVWCYAVGYVQDNKGGSSGYHVTGDFVTLRLRKGGAITGAVTDSFGAPMVKAKVVAIRVRDSQSRAVRFTHEWDNVKQGETDDRGIYRIYGLASGSYLLKVNHIVVYQDQDLSNEIPIYYPSSGRDDAQEVRVSLGQEVSGINISYRSEPGHTISGKCYGAADDKSPGGYYLKLINAKSGVIQDSSWKGYEANSSFAFHGVPDGDYYLIAQKSFNDPYAASQPRSITVRGADATGLELTLLWFGSIAGHIVMEVSPKAKRKPECKPAREASVEETVVNALRNDKATPKDLLALFFDSITSGAPDEKGDFIVTGLPPGQYRLKMKLINEDLYARAVTMPKTGRQPGNAARNDIALKSGEHVKGVIINVAEGAASIRGRVAASDEKAKLPARLRAHLVPFERENAGNAERFAETDTESDGAFAFANIAPDRYWLLVRPIADNEKQEATWPVAWDVAGRAALRREAEAANIAVDLQPCERITNYLMRYRPSLTVTRPASGKTNQ